MSRALVNHCENLRYSLAQEEESSAGRCLDGAPSVLLRSIPTPQGYLSQDRTKAFCRLSRSGMTLGLLTDDRGEELLMLFLAGSLVRTLPSPEREQGLMEADQDYGKKWRGLSVRYDLDTLSWRTHQCLSGEDLQESSLILPKWGSMRGGELSERMMSALPTNERGSGLWPTPLYRDFRSNQRSPESRKKWGTVCLPEVVGGRLNPTWVEWLMGWPLGWTELKF